MVPELSLRRFLVFLTRIPVFAMIVILSAGTLVAAEEKAAPAVDLKSFLVSTKGTYGWEPVQASGDGLSYDFFPDGRLHIQGKDGEASMWEGKWSVSGDKVTMTNSTKKTKKTVTAKVEGKELLLDGVRYRRYKAQ
jgi:hypothetical protein